MAGLKVRILVLRKITRREIGLRNRLQGSITSHLAHHIVLLRMLLGFDHAPDCLPDLHDREHASLAGTLR